MSPCEQPLPGTFAEQFEFLYERFAHPVYTLILSHVKNRPDADDILQSVFVKLFTSRRAVRLALGNPAYLFQMARRMTLKFLKRKTRERQLTDVSAWQLVESTPQVSILENAEYTRKINGMLTTLLPEQREVVVLKIYGERTLEEIAAITQSPVSTVHKRYQTAIQKLRDKWVSF